MKKSFAKLLAEWKLCYRGDQKKWTFNQFLRKITEMKVETYSVLCRLDFMLPSKEWMNISPG